MLCLKYSSASYLSDGGPGLEIEAVVAVVDAGEAEVVFLTVFWVSLDVFLLEVVEGLLLELPDLAVAYVRNAVWWYTMSEIPKKWGKLLN